MYWTHIIYRHTATELGTFALQSKNDLFGPDSEQLVDVLLLLSQCFTAVANYEDAESFLNQVNNDICSMYLLSTVYITYMLIIYYLLYL